MPHDLGGGGEGEEEEGEGQGEMVRELGMGGKRGEGGSPKWRHTSGTPKMNSETPKPVLPPPHLQLPRPRSVPRACDGQSVGHNHYALRSHRAAAAADPKASRAEQA